MTGEHWPKFPLHHKNNILICIKTTKVYKNKTNSVKVISLHKFGTVCPICMRIRSSVRVGSFLSVRHYYKGWVVFI